jgi:ribonuclease BN (tRNA processing enzyme)
LRKTEGDILMQKARRRLLRALAASGLATALSPYAAMAQQGAGSGSRLILLGTQGGPNFNLERGEAASVLVVNDVPYLVDCGYGALRAVLQSGLRYQDIGHVFLTHLHDDHVADLVSLLGHQWTQGRVDPTVVHGPNGTDTLVDGILLYQQANTRIRMHDEARTLDPATVFKADVLPATAEPTVVFRDDRVTVSAVQNTHYPQATLEQLPDRALSFRFDCPDRSIVFSGDTTYSPGLVALARGADVLVCEAMDHASIRAAFEALVAAGNYGDNPEGIWTHIVETHSSTQQAGRMAAEAGVRTLVFNHVLPGALNSAVADAIYIAGAREHFAGNIIVGYDQLQL